MYLFDFSLYWAYLLYEIQMIKNIDFEQIIQLFQKEIVFLIHMQSADSTW